MVFEGNFKLFRYRVELEAVQVRQQNTRQRNRIENRRLECESLPSRIFFDETDIKRRVVRDHDRPLAECQKFRQNLFDRRRADYHAVVDACQLFNVIGDWHFRVDKCAEFVHNLSIRHTHRADLDDAVLDRAETGRLDIEYNAGVV